VNNLRAFFLAVAICCIQAAHAQSLPDRVRSCASQSDAAARLQCYDQLAASLDRSSGGAAEPVTPASVSRIEPSADTGHTSVGSAPATASAGTGYAATNGAPGTTTTHAASASAPSTPTTAAPGTAFGGAAESPPSPESQFGIAGGKLQRKKEAATPKEIQAVVSGVARRPRGELVITLDNGQVWVQLEPQAYYPLEAGETVHISKGVLGSYLLTTPAKRGSKVTRIL
jgi:hypothetical protein